MHGAAFAYVVENAPNPPGDVLDVGGRDINGSLRYELGDATSWTVVDLVEAPDVDIVGDVRELGLVDVADVVLCIEVLEHSDSWAEILEACATACRPGGQIIVTAAGPARSPHSAIDGGELRKGEHYANIDPADLAAAIEKLPAVDGYELDELGADVRATIQIAVPAKAPRKPRKATAKKR